MALFSHGIPPGSAEEPPPVPLDESKSIQGVEAKETPKSAEKMDVRESAPVFPSLNGGPDQYGYTWDDTQPLDTIGVLTDTLISSGSGNDDRFEGPVQIGFPFQFYENTYTDLFVTTNGLITFLGGSSDYNNRPIPFVGEPQAFIAPFWDDLIILQGNVYQKHLTNPNRLVIAWQDVAIFGSPGNLLSFEAILHQDGKICFQYQKATGDPAKLNSGTVGIEDSDGVDGLSYLYNAPGILSLLNSQTALCFTRPSPARQVKMLPVNQGAFTNNGRSEFEVVVRNIGVGPDTIELEPQLPPGSNWTIRLFDESTSSLLSNTNGIPTVDTGPLAPNSPFTMTVQLIAPAGAPIGSYLHADLTAKSSNDLNEKWTVGLDSAVPAPFAQAFMNKKPDVGFQLNWEFSQDFNIVSDAIGSSVGIIQLPLTGGYMTVWEDDGGIAQNIVYRMQDENGLNVDVAKDIISSSERDQEPALAESNGMVGAAWVRNDIGDFDIMFTILDAFSDPFNPVKKFDPVNVTNNSNSSISFYDPRVSATEDNNFVIAWVEDLGNDDRDVWFSIYSSSGSSVFGPVNFTDTSIKNENPSVTQLSNTTNNDNPFLLTYTNIEAGSTQIYYAVIKSNGATISAPQPLTGGFGTNPTGKELPGGRIILAWTDEATNQIAYAALDESNYSMAVGVTLLNTPDKLAADFVSITHDQDDHGILTWMDDDLDRSLYYALIDPSGALLTPPTVFYSGGLGDTINPAGHGNAPYIGRILINLPLVQR